MSQGSKKRAAASSDLTSRKRASAIIPLKDSLEQASLREEPKGWRALELGFHPTKGRRTLGFRTAFLSDLTELQGCRSSRTREENKHVQRGENGKFCKHSSNEQIDPLSIFYLTYSWGVGKNFAAEMSKTRRVTGSVGATLTKKATPTHEQQEQENASNRSATVNDPPVVEQEAVMGASVAAAAAAAAARLPIANASAGQQATLSSSQPTQTTPQSSAQLVRTNEQFTQMAQDTRTLFQHAHANKYGKGWRARQKGISSIQYSREFQQDSLSDLVVMRACLSDDTVYNNNGPACLDNVAFAWNVNRTHFQKLFQGKRAASNQQFATALARALNAPTTATQEMVATSISTPISLVDRLLAKSCNTPRKPPPKALKDLLAEGCAWQKSKGWRARELGFPNGKVGRLHDFRNSFLLDLAELRGLKSALPVDSTLHSLRASNGKFTKANKNTMHHDPFTISNLNYAWGVGRNYANSLMNPEPLKERMRLQRKKGKDAETHGVLKALKESAQQNSKTLNQHGMTCEASI